MDNFKIDCKIIDIFYARDEWTDESLVDQLSGAMSVLTTLARNRGLAHTTEVGFGFVSNLIQIFFFFFRLSL